MSEGGETAVMLLEFRPGRRKNVRTEEDRVDGDAFRGNECQNSHETETETLRGTS